MSATKPHFATVFFGGLIGVLLVGPMAADSPPEDGLVAAWEFDHDTKSYAHDSSGLGHTGHFSGDPNRTAGVLGGALSMSGDDALVITPSVVLNQLTTLTLSAWIRHPPTSQFRSILDHRDRATDGYDLYLDPQARLFMRVGSATLVGNRSVADGTWHHVVGTYDGDSLRLYVDGELEASAWVGPQDLDITDDPYVGRHFTSPNYSYAGDLDEVRVYSRPLSDDEVHQLFEKVANPSGQDSRPPFRFSANPLGLLAGEPTHVNLELETDELAECRFSVTSGMGFDQMPGRFDQIDDFLHSRLVALDNQSGLYTFYVRCSDLVGNHNSEDLEIFFSTTESDPLDDVQAYWSFDDAQGTIAQSVPDRDLDAHLINGPTWTFDGMRRTAIEFDGNDDFAWIEDSSVHPALDLANLTLMTWVRPGPFRHSQVQALVSKDEAYEFEIGQASEDTYSIRLGNVRRGRGTTHVRPGLWQHLAVTWDGETVRYYYNGNLDGETPYDGPVTISDQPVGLGGRPPSFDGGASSHNFLGTLDEIQVADRALEPSEIYAAYAAGLPEGPSLKLLEPNGLADSAETGFTVTWIDHDPDDNALISLYYDTDREGADGVLLAEGISEDDESDAFLWDLTEVPTGGYYLYGIIDDGHNPPVLTYSEGPVMVRVQTEITDVPSLTDMLDGTPVTCHAATTPAGFERYITWAASTMYGMGGTVAPEKGRGSSFTAVWNLDLNEETNSYWFQIQANEASIQEDPPDPCEDVDCNDGNSCTADRCQNGRCVHTQRNCDDLDPCTIDSCGSNGCIHQPLDCDDSNLCTQDSCQYGACVNTPRDCSDGTVCTIDSCDTATGQCLNVPTAEGGCCEDDGNPCTQDLCMEGACLHPLKPDPIPRETSYSFSVSRTFTKHLVFPGFGNAVGYGTSFAVNAGTMNSTTSQGCSFGSTVGGSASLNATFIGKGVTIDGDLSGGWTCEDPLTCPQGWGNRKICDKEQRCCQVEGGGRLTVSRSMTLRKAQRFGSFYLEGSFGGGMTGSVQRTAPVCTENETTVRLGPVVLGSASGGLEICNGFTRRVCQCTQGRDKWTGKFLTACSECSRCSPKASATFSAEATAQLEWKTPSGGFRGVFDGKACLNVGGITIGPLTFEGYKLCYVY